VDERTTNVRARAGTVARIAALLASSAIAIACFDASAAAAHSASGPRPTNYRSTLEGVAPEIPGVTIRIVDLGEKIELTNDTSNDVTVLGYYREPYLRVGPRGVYENLRSPATYINRNRTGDTPIPEIARGTGASTPPRWQRVSSAQTVRWHDHRVHFMGTTPPAAVRADPDAFHTINQRWTVLMQHGAQEVEVHGRLDWVPAPSGRPWVPFAAGLFVLGLLVARSKSRGALVAAVVALVVVDASHAISAEVARAGPVLGKTLQFFGDNWVSLIVWILAGLTIWALWRRDHAATTLGPPTSAQRSSATRASGSAGRTEALFGVLILGVMVALIGGLTDLSYLWKSQLPTAGPNLVARAEVATALGLGLGLAAGALLRLVRSAPEAPARPARDPDWLERLVAGLDDDAIALESTRLDAAEVVPLALSDFATRLESFAPDLGSDAIVFVVLAQDEVGAHVWSLVAAPLGASGLRLQRGRPAPARTELRSTFPAFLSLLGGTLTVDAAVAAGRLVVDGDAALVSEIEPYFTTAGRRLPAAHGQ
jgi:hypothetical protein